MEHLVTWSKVQSSLGPFGVHQRDPFGDTLLTTGTPGADDDDDSVTQQPMSMPPLPSHYRVKFSTQETQNDDADSSKMEEDDAGNDEYHAGEDSPVAETQAAAAANCTLPGGGFDYQGNGYVQRTAATDQDDHDDDASYNHDVVECGDDASGSKVKRGHNAALHHHCHCHSRKGLTTTVTRAADPELDCFRKSHCLVSRPLPSSSSKNKTRSPLYSLSSFQESAGGEDDSLDLSPGENWLRLVTVVEGSTQSKHINSVLDDDDDDDGEDRNDDDNGAHARKQHTEAGDNSTIYASRPSQENPSGETQLHVAHLRHHQQSQAGFDEKLSQSPQQAANHTGNKCDLEENPVHHVTLYHEGPMIRVFPSVLSLDDLGGRWDPGGSLFDAARGGDDTTGDGDCCFLSFDVDGDITTIKDMRWPKRCHHWDGDNEGDDNTQRRLELQDQFEIFIGRHGQSTWLVPSSLQSLPRRQLRLLKPGDVIAIRWAATTRTTNDHAAQLVCLLEYRHDVIIRTPATKNDGEAQGSYDSFKPCRHHFRDEESMHGGNDATVAVDDMGELSQTQGFGEKRTGKDFAVKCSQGRFVGTSTTTPLTQHDDAPLLKDRIAKTNSSDMGIPKLLTQPVNEACASSSDIMDTTQSSGASTNAIKNLSTEVICGTEPSRYTGTALEDHSEADARHPHACARVEEDNDVEQLKFVMATEKDRIPSAVYSTITLHVPNQACQDPADEDNNVLGSATHHTDSSWNLTTYLISCQNMSTSNVSNAKKSISEICSDASPRADEKPVDTACKHPTRTCPELPLQSVRPGETMERTQPAVATHGGFENHIDSDEVDSNDSTVDPDEAEHNFNRMITKGCQFKEELNDVTASVNIWKPTGEVAGHSHNNCFSVTEVEHGILQGETQVPSSLKSPLMPQSQEAVSAPSPMAGRFDSLVFPNQLNCRALETYSATKGGKRLEGVERSQTESNPESPVADMVCKPSDPTHSIFRTPNRDESGSESKAKEVVLHGEDGNRTRDASSSSLVKSPHCIIVHLDVVSMSEQKMHQLESSEQARILKPKREPLSHSGVDIQKFGHPTLAMEHIDRDAVSQAANLQDASQLNSVKPDGFRTQLFIAKAIESNLEENASTVDAANPNRDWILTSSREDPMSLPSPAMVLDMLPKDCDCATAIEQMDSDSITQSKVGCSDEAMQGKGENDDLTHKPDFAINRDAPMVLANQLHLAQTRDCESSGLALLSNESLNEVKKGSSRTLNPPNSKDRRPGKSARSTTYSGRLTRNNGTKARLKRRRLRSSIDEIHVLKGDGFNKEDQGVKRVRSTLHFSDAHTLSGVASYQSEQANQGDGINRKFVSPAESHSIEAGKILDEDRMIVSHRKAATERACSAPSRKRRLSFTRTSSVDDGLRVLFTNVEASVTDLKRVRKIGGVVIDDAREASSATLVIAASRDKPLRRTPKLMIGLCRTPNIVSYDWLLESDFAGRALPCEPFLLVRDSTAEKLYKFSMRDTLARVSAFLARGTFLLSSWSVYVCEGVAGGKAPPEDEFRLIVEAAGGIWLSSLDGIASPTQASKILVITSDQARRTSSNVVAEVVAKGATKRSTSWLFQVLIKQELDILTNVP